MIRLLDILSMGNVNPVAVRHQGKESEFHLGRLMDEVNRQVSKTILLTDFDATHSGTEVNHRVYPGRFVRDSIVSWTTPYAKPVLERHIPAGHKPGDQEPKTYGRVRSAAYIQLVDDALLVNDWKKPPRRDRGSGFIRLSTEIADPGAIEEILDRRFLTVSSGMDTNHLFCSMCGGDWIKEDGRCEHRPGQSYELEDGQSHRMFFITGHMEYDHLARCTTPAQPYSTVLSTQIINAKDVSELFSDGEVLDGSLHRLCLIDSEAGATEILFQETPVRPDPTASWTEQQWAEASLLAAIADVGRLKDGALDRAGSTIKAYRTSERKPRLGKPRFLFGPNGCIPIYDKLTALAAVSLVDQVVGARTGLKDRLLECVGSFTSVTLGDSTMTEPSKDWAEVVKGSEGLSEAQCSDWSDFQDDMLELSYEEAQAEMKGAAAGIIAQDAVLSAKARKSLPDSSFCGPGRSFPANDAAHVRNGLARLPQATRFSSAQKSRILNCLRGRASKMGVTVGKDDLDFDKLARQLDQHQAPPPPPAETPEQATKRLDGQLSATKAKIADQETIISKLTDEAKDLRGELHRILASKVFDLKSKLEKPDVKALDSEAKKQEFRAKLELRTTISLRDSIVDLEAELAKPATPPAPVTTPPTTAVVDPTKGALQDEQLKAAAAAAEKAVQEAAEKAKKEQDPAGTPEAGQLRRKLRGQA